MNTESNVKIKVSEIQRFCMHDGPGVRTTVFFKGCPLDCAWCHNPETKKKRSELLYYAKKCISCGACASMCQNDAHSFCEGHIFNRALCKSCFKCADVCPSRALEICGKDYTVDEIMDVVKKDAAFYSNGGGLTVSGGEPLMQGEGAISLLRSAKESGFATALDTCGYFGGEIFRAAAEYTDLFLFDLKDTDSERHKRYTGVSNEKIIENLFFLDSLGARIRLRCVLVNGVNSNAEHYEKVAQIAKNLKNCDGVDVLPYHAYAGSKATFIGESDNGRVEWIPNESQTEEFKRAVR